MGKIPGFPKHHDHAKSTTNKESGSSGIRSAVKDGTILKKRKVSTKQLRKLMTSKIDVTDKLVSTTQEHRKGIKIHVLSGNSQPENKSLNKQALLPVTSLDSTDYHKRKPVKNKKKKKQLKAHVSWSEANKVSFEGGNIPLSVVMPDTLPQSDIQLTLPNCILLETETMQETGNEHQNDLDDTLPVVCAETLHKKEAVCRDIPLVVSMTQPADLVHVDDLGRRTSYNDGQNTERNCESPESKDLEHGNLGNSISNEESTESKQSIQKKKRSDMRKKNTSKMCNDIIAHLVGNSVVLQLSHPQYFYITGQVHIQVLCGRLKILGYEMDSSSGSHVVSSLRGSSFLSMQPIPSLDRVSVIPSDIQEGSAVQSLISQSKPNETWVLLKKGDQAYLDFMQKYLEYPIYAKEFKPGDSMPIYEAQNKLKCVFQPEQNLGKRMFLTRDWDDLPKKLNNFESGCAVLCGGKGVGKSTLLRYLVNRALCKRESGSTAVVLLDLDPGQAELTPPGCVALSVITQPLLGPNYTHLQNSERCIYLGQVDVCQCLDQYMEACSSLITFLRESTHLANLPCFVNTMGFNKGIGVTIMGQLLKLLQPTHVVQIQSKRPSTNYPFHLIGSAVMKNSRSLDARSISNNLRVFSSQKEPDVNLNHELILLQSMAERGSSKNENQWGMKPKMCRDAAVLSYFYQTANRPSYSFLEDVPYTCVLSSLYLCVAHEQIPPDLVLSAMIGNMVGLCTIDPLTESAMYPNEPGMHAVLNKVPIAPCFGFGIVRGVDMPSKKLFVTTPLNEEQLITVNCLVFGAVNLPTTLYMKMTAPGVVPYVSSGAHPSVSMST